MTEQSWWMEAWVVIANSGNERQAIVGRNSTDIGLFTEEMARSIVWERADRLLTHGGVSRGPGALTHYHAKPLAHALTYIRDPELRRKVEQMIEWGPVEEDDDDAE